MLNYLKKFIISYIGMLILFLATLFLSCLIPSALLKNNIGRTLTVFTEEGTYPSFGIPVRQIVLDNFTDPLLFNIAYSIDSKKPIQSALTTAYSVGQEDQANQIANLKKLYLNSTVKKIGYERYWHGYLIYLRPLLTIFSYREIRIILTILLWGGVGWFLYLSGKKLGKKVALFFLIGFLTVDFFYLGQSIQFSQVFLIGLVSSIYLLLKNKQNPYLLFFIVGGLTAFFDLLTAPLITLELLLITTMLLSKRREISKIIYYSLVWTIGYLSLWLSKWVIASISYTPKAVTTSIAEILNRTVARADANFSQLAAIRLNMFQLIGYNKINKYLVLFLAILFLLFFSRYCYFKIKNFRKALFWIIIGSIPLAWYIVAANHSYLHVWYTYRNLWGSVVGAFLAVSELINWQKVKKDRLRLKTATKN